MLARRFFQVRHAGQSLGRFAATTAEDAIDGAIEHHAIAYGRAIDPSTCSATPEAR